MEQSTRRILSNSSGRQHACIHLLRGQPFKPLERLTYRTSSTDISQHMGNRYICTYTHTFINPNPNPHLPTSHPLPSSRRSSSQSIQPSPQPIPTLRNLQLNIRLRAHIIRAIELLVRLVGFEHVDAVQRVGVLCPSAATGALVYQPVHRFLGKRWMRDGGRVGGLTPARSLRRC